MADIFISYSRRNQKFVVDLCSTLEARDLDVWVDVDDLYAGEEFWPEVRRAIDAATVVIFVLSPDSAASGPCNHELDHAVSAGKRIVPVLRVDVKEAIPEAVANLQWVFFRKQEDVSSATESLMSAINADWAALRTQARFLRRASEWVEAQEDDSLLLRGSDLRDAIAWRDAERGKETGATPLHKRYIDSGIRARKHARLRATGYAAGTVAAIVVLGWLAAGFWLNSVANRVSFDVAANTDSVTLADLETARRVCDYAAGWTDSCSVVTLVLGHGYDQSGRYDEAIDAYSQSLELTSAADDEASLEVRGNAFQSRAFSRVLQAESAGGELDAYQLAESDMEAAMDTYRRTAGGLGGKVFDKFRARIAIGMGAFDDADHHLDRAVLLAPDDPEIGLIRAALRLCQGRQAEGLQLFTTYTLAMRDRLGSPQWNQATTYFEGVKQRCLTNDE